MPFGALMQRCMVAGVMSGACVIGVDLGGTKLLAGVVDADLRVHHRTQRLVPHADTAALLDSVTQAVEEARGAARDPVVGVGFGIACLMDDRRGVAATSVHLPIADLPFADVMRERTGLPVEVDNDANAAMLVEWRAGAAHGATDALLLTIGTGIGGGMVVAGRLATGTIGAGAGARATWSSTRTARRARAAAPAAGASRRTCPGRRSGGPRGKVALEEPESALGRLRASGRAVTGPLVTELAWDGDPVARALIERCGRHLGIGITSLVNIFNPSVVVVGGGVIAAGDMLLEPARAVVAQRALWPARDVVEIVPARFGQEAGMLGAATMALEAAGLRTASSPAPGRTRA